MTEDEDIEISFRKRIVEDIRPWGRFRAYPYESGSAVKIVTVDPGQTLSLQTHDRRAEFWIALDPGLEVTVNDKTWRPKENEEIFIPRKALHRVRCVGSLPARIMEIWIGDPDESDIVRVEDEYGR
jgi:mannose-6-phosphate isomerase-like protein (cupin superfamily)